MTLTELRRICKEKGEKYPELKKNIQELFELCLTEIEEGGSTTAEIYNCYHDVMELVKEKTKNT